MLGASIDPRVLAAHPGIVDRVRPLLGDLMESTTQSRGKRVWCDKSPSNLHHLALLETLFPDALYLCLYRNCLDVSHSILEICRHGFMLELESYVHQSPNNLIKAAVSFWSDEMSMLLAFERRRLERCHRVRYEDLVADPEAVLRAAFAFLGVEWQPGLVNAVFKTRHGRGIGDPKVEFSDRIHGDSVGAGQVLPRNRIPGPLLVRMRSLEEQIGYGSEPGAARPAAPPPAAAAPAGFTEDLEEPKESPAAAEVRRIFAELPQRARDNAGAPAAADASYKLVVSGAGGGAWVLDLRGGACRVREGSAEAAFSLSLSVADFLDIVHGRLNAMAAGMNGRVKVSGEPGMDDLQRLIRLLQSAA